jgi:hypothetical protein
LALKVAVGPTAAQSWVARLEGGNMPNPEPETLRAACELYGVSYIEAIRILSEEKYGLEPEIAALITWPKADLLGLSAWVSKLPDSSVLWLAAPKLVSAKCREIVAGAAELLKRGGQVTFWVTEQDQEPGGSFHYLMLYLRKGLGYQGNGVSVITVSEFQKVLMTGFVIADPLSIFTETHTSAGYQLLPGEKGPICMQMGPDSLCWQVTRAVRIVEAQSKPFDLVAA